MVSKITDKRLMNPTPKPTTAIYQALCPLGVMITTGAPGAIRTASARTHPGRELLVSATVELTRRRRRSGGGAR
jgi:hypothetical protein